jgi:SAM-dependent methyltransferase
MLGNLQPTAFSGASYCIFLKQGYFVFVFMNRSITNAIRYVMDNWLPPSIRDANWFMYPIFYIWFKGKNVALYMNFKDIAYTLTEDEFSDVYRNLDCLAYDRPTDMNMPSIKYLVGALDKDAKSLLDVGCGRGFLLNFIAEHTALELTGCDLYDNVPTLKQASYKKGSIYNLPFEDKSFDVVTCSHTIEHLRDVKPAIDELKRVARKQIIIVTPRQRYYFYTVDLHLNFYPLAAYLQKEINIKDNVCTNIQGDWVYIGKVN